MASSILALLAALSFALGSTLQQKGALETPAPEGDPRFLVQLLARPAWLAGAGFQALGWVAQALALEAGSLVVVQSLCTLSLVFALPLGARLTAQRIDRRAVAGATCTLLGLVTFLAVGEPQGGDAGAPTGGTLVAAAGLAGAALVVIAWTARRERGAVASALFATGAGVSFGLQAAVTKVFVSQIGGGLALILTSASTYLLILSALVGFTFQQSALKTGFLAPAMAASNATTLATSVLLGVVLFDESIASAGRLPLSIGALLLAIVGVVVLATPRPGAAFEAETPGPDVDGPPPRRAVR